MKRWLKEHPPIIIYLNSELHDWLKNVTSETGQSYTGFITQLLMRYKDLDKEIETKAKEIAEKMFNEEKAKLNEWLKEKATEIYERGHKDGYDKGYNDGFIDGFKVALMDIQSGNINTYALSDFKITEYTTTMQICNILYYSPSQCPFSTQ
jgi:flagellar biosynthesis/type III secretory pathway protein FliH